MAERPVQRLFVFLPPHRAVAGARALSSSTVVHYVATGGTVAAQSGQTPIALLSKANAVDLVFDSSDVFVTAVEAPRLSDAKLRQALPNLLEDRLLAETQDSHYAFQAQSNRSSSTTVGGNPKLPVAVIDRGLLTRALDTMADAGYRVRTAYSALYTVPAPAAGVLSVRVSGGRDLARTGKHEGFAFEFDGKTMPAALQLAVRQLGVKKVVAFGADAAALARLAGELGVEVEVARVELDLDATEDGVNLLQGAFASGGLSSLALPKLSRGALRLPLIYGAAAAVVYVIGMNAYWLKLKSEDTAIRSGMETAFRSAFPDANAVVDPVLQTKRNMGALRARAGIASADDFSVLNAQAAQLMTMAPIGAVSGVEYRDGALRVKFKPGMVDNPAIQNTLRAQAIQQGLNVRFEPDNSARITPAGG